MTFSPEKLKSFKKEVWNYYKKNKRAFPWRETSDPYRILVSEIMLQQTQADRVVEKYNSFLKKWPTVKKLAQAELVDVLKEWSGLGYNRRGKNLWLLAKSVMATNNQNNSKQVSRTRGVIPSTPEELENLPGIGPYTARAILAFAFGKPYACIETNIRAVFIYYFFSKSKTKISDDKLFPLIEATLDRKNPREWYYALMDHGSYLKKQKLSTNDKHKIYRKQATFKGSTREARGAILRALIKSDVTLRKLKEKIKHENQSISDTKINDALTALGKEKIIVNTKGIFSIISS